MGTNKITGMGDPIAAQDATTKNYVDMGLALKQNSLGFTPVDAAGDTMSGALAMGTNKITGMGDPKLPEPSSISMVNWASTA